MGKWYDTGFKEAMGRSPADPPMNPGNKMHADYMDGYRDGERQLEIKDAGRPIPSYAFNDDGEQVHDYDLGDDE